MEGRRGGEFHPLESLYIGIGIDMRAGFGRDACMKGLNTGHVDY